MRTLAYEEIKLIVDSCKNLSLKSSLLKVKASAKTFYENLLRFPELTKLYEEIQKSKKLESAKKKTGVKRRKFSYRELLEIKEEYLKGTSLDALSKKYKVSPLIIKREFAEAKVPLRSKSELDELDSIKKSRFKTEEEWKRLYDSYVSEGSLDRVCSSFHASTEVAKKMFLKFGWPLVVSKSYPIKIKTSSGIKTIKDVEYWQSVYDFYKDHKIGETSSYCGVSQRRLKNIFERLSFTVRTTEEERRFNKDYSKGRATVDNIFRALEEYELLDEFKGYSENGVYKKYRIRHLKCGRVFERTLHDLYKMRCYYCYPKSKGETMLYSLVPEGVQFIKGDRYEIHPLELDLYIPSMKLAFEYNGCYWHSELFVEKDYHKNKTEKCLDKGIKLVHFWDNCDMEIMKSRVNQMFGRVKKVFARNTEIREVSAKERKDFFNRCHISGDTSSSFAMGLFYNNELVSCMSFRKLKDQMELARFASELNLVVVGGFSKLLKRCLIKLKELGIKRLVTYCNRDWTPDYSDSVYFKNGFEFEGSTGLIMKYYNEKTGKVHSREKYQKHKLLKMFPEYDGGDVNSFLLEKGIVRMYNSGNWKFSMEVE